MPIELETALDNIAEVTLKLPAIYQKIAELKMTENNPLPNYQTRLNELIKELAAIKKEEEEYYKIFSNPTYAISALQFLHSRTISHSGDDATCAQRMIKRIARINASIFINNPDAIPKENKDELVEFLVSKGHPLVQSHIDVLVIAGAIEISLATAYNNIQYLTLKDITEPSIRSIYIKRILDQSLLLGESFEQRLMDCHFTTLKNHLNDDLANTLRDDFISKKVLVDKFATNNLKGIIYTFFTTKDPETLDDMLNLFKAHILHLSDEALQIHKSLITVTALFYNADPKQLLKELDYVIGLRKKAKGEKNNG